MVYCLRYLEKDHKIKSLTKRLYINVKGVMKKTYKSHITGVKIIKDGGEIERIK